MAVTITIRNVPEPVRDKLKARAERRSQSMQEFLRLELERIASRPSSEESMERLRKRKAETGVNVPASVILEHRYADRK